MQVDALVVGGGPAGLMAAEALLDAGRSVTLVEAKPSVARKFLMAGKSGLNLTRMQPEYAFLKAYSTSGSIHPVLRDAVNAFGPNSVRAWAEALGQPTFCGSTGRLFPGAMKASPLLRAWLGKLDTAGLVRHTRWRWTGWDEDAVRFDTPDGPHHLCPKVTVFALGGASWRRLGSDGAWARVFEADGHGIVPFQPSNVGLAVNWSDHMTPYFGAAIKSVGWRAGKLTSRGEAILSKHGLEGGGIYSLAPALRTPGAALEVDLVPDLSPDDLQSRLPETPKRGVGRILRNTLRLPSVKQALFREFTARHPVPYHQLAAHLKALPIHHAGLRPMDEAISTTGGLSFDALDETLMLKARPGTFCAGEMLDWDAPTGGYLLTACFATGLWAGRHAAAYGRP
ncbi:TIGR03862 family flavoprotein [Marivita sp. GX14005]|uniref:NAD(P)/FAD-dependent oxidoreductase n=1 Tax=Marivita sp. GX14005 TaxID=2942276 RepID=UPI0020190D1B|nr:TIGR03862 family flavoprotein [Marivita sp. GX14005]MCL3881861.1 TIGR03862 family flavoprotein [Marivita sp. GX14005]